MLIITIIMLAIIRIKCFISSIRKCCVSLTFTAEGLFLKYPWHMLFEVLWHLISPKNKFKISSWKQILLECIDPLWKNVSFHSEVRAQAQRHDGALVPFIPSERKMQPSKTVSLMNWRTSDSFNTKIGKAILLLPGLTFNQHRLKVCVME